MSYGLILQIASIYGAIISVLLSGLIIGTLRFNAEMWLNDYPLDIRAKFGPMSGKARAQRMIAALVFLVVAIVPFLAGLVQLFHTAAGELPFFAVFVYTFVSLSIFNLVDLVIIDWLLIVTIQPRFVILPGTEGLDGYRNYWFHFRAFLIGTVGIMVFAVLVAAGSMLF